MPAEAHPLHGDSVSEAEQGAQEPEAQGWLPWFKRKVKQLKQEVVALYYASQDPRTPLLSKGLLMLALAYALSPIDLIPDFIPVLGLLDDFLILPGLLWLAVRLVPAGVLADARRKAELKPLRLSKNRVAAVFVFAVWDVALLTVAWWLLKAFARGYLHNHVAALVVGLGVVLSVAEAAWLIVMTSRERSSSGIDTEAARQPLLHDDQPAAV